MENEQTFDIGIRYPHLREEGKGRDKIPMRDCTIMSRLFRHLCTAEMLVAFGEAITRVDGIEHPCHHLATYQAL